MKEKLTFLMLMIMASALFSSCDQKMKELKEQVDKFNKACPMSFGDIMTLNSTVLDNNVVEMKLTANETVAVVVSSIANESIIDSNFFMETPPFDCLYLYYNIVDLNIQ